MSNQLKIFDSHCHLDFPVFDDVRDALIEKAKNAGVCGILIPGVEQKNWRCIRQITARYPLCHTALGLHPMFVENHQKSHLHDLELALSVGPIAAVGEIGLDFYKPIKNQQLQREYFDAQVLIAKEAELPVLLHVRKAHDEVLRTLKFHHFESGGVVHAFNGNESQAQKYIDLGFKLGFGGTMTYPRAVKLRQLASQLPLSSIVLETDAPDMPPITCKKGFNTPLHLFDNFNSLVSLRDEPALAIAEQTTQNICSVINLDKCV